MTGLRFLPNRKILAFAALLCMAINSPVLALDVVSAPDVDTSIGTLLGLDTAWKALQTGWNAVQVYWEGLIGFNTGANGVASSLNSIVTAKLETNNTQAQMNHAYQTAVGREVADQAMRLNTNDLAVAVCAPATLGSGLSVARAGVANFLTETPPGGCNVTATTGAGPLPSSCIHEFSPTKSSAQRITDLAGLVQSAYGESNSDPKMGTYPHADTSVNNFTNDRTFTVPDQNGFRTFETWICGLPPENPPNNSTARSQAAIALQVVNQHATIAGYNLCLQTFSQYAANHQPVTANTSAATAASAIVSVYSASLGSQMAPSPAFQAAIANNSFSMEEILHAMYQGIPEGGDGAGANIFTQIAGLHDGMAALKMVATQLIMTNYMEYERKTIEERNLMVNSAILARLDRGGIIQR